MGTVDPGSTPPPFAAAYQRFPSGFFRRIDEDDDADFYGPARLVTHIDDAAIDAVGTLYEELAVNGTVLDLMSSWISHFRVKPAHLTVLGMNAEELEANPQADAVVVRDLNRDGRLPFADATFDDVVCCVSVDYLVKPLEVFAEVRRVLRPGGRFVCTFSNRCFPTKAILGWHGLSGAQRCELVETYFGLSGSWETIRTEHRIPPGRGSDPLHAVWGRRPEFD